MPRTGKPRTRAVYWWSDEIAALRDARVAARRRYTRARRRANRDAARETVLYEGFRQATVALQTAIKRAKSEAWRELLDSLDRDPWGRPYRLVMGRLRPVAPPVTGSLDPPVLRRVVDTLFPVDPEEPRPPELADPTNWSAELGVTQGEFLAAVRRLGVRNTAPGPDGVPGRALKGALRVLGPRLVRLFDRCMESGRVPLPWKRARMVLVPKKGKPADSPSAYRPICLLDEIGKLFERVIAGRVGEALSRDGPGIAECQFGFRVGRSTLDAVDRVKFLADTAVSRGGVALAISLDIANAFNSLPWDAIRAALREHEVPPYLRAVMSDYLRDRVIEYPGRDGLLRRAVSRGVPQGSVLGPLLWNVGYDSVLRGPLPVGASVVCYADDTLLVVSGRDWTRTVRLAEMAVALVVARIRALGLQISPQKTEVVWFHGLPLTRRAPDTRVRVGEASVQVADWLKYLGLGLDSRWRFEGHFDRLVPRVVAVSTMLGRLLPNLGGPEERVRRLYVGVVRAMALYGAPVWASGRAVSRRSRHLLRRVQRLMAIRVARGYRTLAHETAAVLAGVVPFDIQAEADADVYRRLQILRRSRDAPLDPAVEDDMRRQSRRSAREKWRRELERSGAARQRAVGAILPSFNSWLDRRHGRLTYRVTQMLSGHGCFGKYLESIGAEETTRCHWCGAALDSAQHTLEECPAFAAQRRVLRLEVGADLSLPAVIAAIVDDEAAWRAFASFCENVMSRKEAEEREREASDPVRAERRRARRARGRRIRAAPDTGGLGPP